MPTTTKTETTPVTETPAPELAHETLNSFLATLDEPDAELSRLADELAGAHARAEALTARQAELRRRREVLDAALAGGGAVGPEPLTERVLVKAELEVLPAARAAATRDQTLCRLGYLRRIVELARAEVTRCDEALVGPEAEAAAVVRSILTDDARRYGAPTLTEEERAALEARRATLGAGMRPTRERRERARLAEGVAKVLIDHVAPDVQLYNQATWTAAADRAAEWTAERARREA